MSRKLDPFTAAGLRGLPDCCPHTDDDGKTVRYCAFALGLAIALRGAAESASDEGGQLGAGGDAELGVGLVEVVGDCPRRQEQLGGDVPVG